MQVISPGGKKYFMVCKDDFSRYAQIFFLHSKSEAASKLKSLKCTFSHKI
jgi:hypothetical protein